MASKKSTNISLIVLGSACLIAVGYFIWLYLAPPAIVSTVAGVVSTDIDTNVVKTGGFHLLQEFVKLPIKAGAVGRANPFSDFAPPAKIETGNSNVPAVNSPEKPPSNGNTN
jgi:hypothetical protein